MTAEKKIAQKGLTWLQLAERLRKVSGACRHREVSGSQIYEYKRAFQKLGIEDLVDQPPLPKSCAREMLAEVREGLIAVSPQHPAQGAGKISDLLRLEGITVGVSTGRNIWVKESLETKYKRLLRLEEKGGLEVELTEEQIRLLERAKPCFRERKVEGSYPGYLLSQDTFHVGMVKGVGRGGHRWDPLIA